jgi:hypothetical protein
VGQGQTLLSGFPESAAVCSGPLVQPATPRVRPVLFWRYVTSGSRTETDAPSCREMYAATKEHSSDRKLKKVTDANYVRHRESSIKTITRENSGRVPENKRDDLLGWHFAQT